MWTINDFPAYRMVSGWKTHEKFACSYCMEKNKAFTLKTMVKHLFLLPPVVLTSGSQIQKE
jgi:hypothetical protein